jgi:hypothetical protein
VHPHHADVALRAISDQKYEKWDRTGHHFLRISSAEAL